MELILVRHALPLEVRSPDGQAVDPSLAPAGCVQAATLANWWSSVGGSGKGHFGAPPDRLYTSPMRRALETAEPLAEAFGLELEVVAGVAEFDRDASEYIPLEALKRRDYPRWKAFVEGAMQGELDLEAFRVEVIACLEGIIRENPGRRVAVVCHGGVINTWAAHLLGLPPKLFMDAGYTSLHRFFAAASGERSVASLNEAPHLEASL
ncbi:MAG: histidine phosphatase family protein [Myxococcota bacterium]|jgi:probable phosphoglycerate mutase